MNIFRIKTLITGIFSLLISLPAFSQENDSVSAATTPQVDTIVEEVVLKPRPLRDVWASTMLVDLPTSYIPAKGSFEVIIQHRFSNLENGIKDLFGIYGASNIRLALNYSIIDQLMIGFATEKDRKYQELYGKVKILAQNPECRIPFSISIFGSASLSARPNDFYGSNYKFMDRLSYFGQLIVDKKFGKVFSMEIAGSFSHINKVESTKVLDTLADLSVIRTRYVGNTQNDIIGISAGARINFYRGLSVILEYDHGFLIQDRSADIRSIQLKPKPNLALGLEINTSTHCFQIFASSYRALNPVQNSAYNQFDFTKLKGLMIGFNITVRLN